jgi:hypothetical protein
MVTPVCGADEGIPAAMGPYASMPRRACPEPV